MIRKFVEVNIEIKTKIDEIENYITANGITFALKFGACQKYNKAEILYTVT